MLIAKNHNGRRVKCTFPREQVHAQGRIIKARQLRDGFLRLYWACGCSHDGTYKQVKEMLSMPQKCDEHRDRPQVSCETCYPDSELQAGLERMQAIQMPTSRSETRKKPKRLDDPSTKPKKRSWKDELFGE